MKAMKWLVIGLALVAGLGRGQVALDAEDLDVVSLRAPQALEAAVASVPEWVDPAPVALADSLGSEFPEPEIAGWATLDAPGRESAQVAAFRPLTLAESDWRRPSTYQVAGVGPWYRPGDRAAGMVFILQGAEAPPPDSTHWDRHGTKWLTGTAVAAGTVLAANQGWIGGGDTKDKTPAVVVDAGRDASVQIGSGNQATQGDDIPPPVAPVEGEALP